jgi:signal recognition particle receptor subunit beta
MKTRPAMKVVLIGNSESKSKFIHEMNSVLNKTDFASNRATIGVDFHRVEHNGDVFTVWDTSGQERFFAISQSYLKNADAIIFCDPTPHQRAAVMTKMSEMQAETPVVTVESKDKLPLACLDEIQQAKLALAQLEQVQAQESSRVSFPASFSQVDADTYLSKSNNVTSKFHNSL